MSIASLLLLAIAGNVLAQVEFRGIYLGMDAYEAINIARKISNTVENGDGFVFTAPIKLANTKISVNIYDNKVDSFELLFDKRDFEVIKEVMVQKYGNVKFCSLENTASNSINNYSYEICVWKLQDGAIYLKEKNCSNCMESQLVMEPLKGKMKVKKSFWSSLMLW